MNKALITGITGQDGSYLAELLLSNGYDVHGIVRRASTDGHWRIDNISSERFHLHFGDLSDSSSIDAIVSEVIPDEVYNLAAQSHVGVSFENPEYTSDITAIGCLRLLESIRKNCPDARYYQASSSEMFGKVDEIPQKETTRFRPRSPYGCSKVFAYWTTVNYREAYGIHASNGILFNHESPRRSTSFVTRKITHAVSRIYIGKQSELVLGNLDAKRDWGYAPEYVEAMWMMLQQENPDDYVIATGETHSVQEFAKLAFSKVGLDWKKYVKTNNEFTRPTEVDILVGDSSRARERLGWFPRTTFKQLVHLMMEEEIQNASKCA